VRFVVSDYSHVPHEYPTTILRRDNWDDYTFKTMFQAQVFLGPDQSLDLDNVKIFRRGQGSQPTELPDTFESLGEEYCSLGQATSYYEMLRTAGRALYEPFLAALRDIVFLPHVREAFIHEDGVQTSLLRFGGAQRALEDAPALFGGDGQAAPAAMAFGYRLPGALEPTEFRFADTETLPGRLAVVIGYNGAGKTRMLASLAMLAYHDERKRVAPDFVAEHGSFVGPAPSFGAIIAVSYSAFDEFQVPRTRGPHNVSAASARNYTYCGLRQIDGGTVSPSLKSIDELTEEFHAARARALEKRREDSLVAALAPIAEEPSFQTIVELPHAAAPDEAWRATFAELSTGHKIVLHIVVQLVAHLERGAIVLIDEPELHLHPPLLAAMLRSIGISLDRHESFAVVATHSPVVLQEVPRKSVKVLRRDFRSVVIEAPEIETFAENVGLLTRYVFNLDSSRTDYQGVLRRLAQDHTIDEIDALFDGSMSSQARSLVFSYQRATPAADAED
jgi:predicted ATPase